MSQSLPVILLHTQRYTFSSQKEYTLIGHSISRQIGTQQLIYIFFVQDVRFKLFSNGTLRINNVEVYDGHLYSCESKTEAGKLSAQARVYVLGEEHLLCRFSSKFGCCFVVGCLNAKVADYNTYIYIYININKSSLRLCVTEHF